MYSNFNSNAESCVFSLGIELSPMVHKLFDIFTIGLQSHLGFILL